MGPLRAVLTSMPLFEGLTPAELDVLFDLAEVRTLKAAQRLFTEGEPADALWLVLEGDVEVSKRAEDSSVTLLAEMGPGAALGELSLFRAATRRSATVTAICPATVLRIPVTSFRKLIAASDLGALKVVNNLAHQLADRLVALNDKLLSKGRKGLSVARSELRRTVL
jgi:CRP/FNR family transcriptional regulator, cyclic AMP receptor protein